MQLSPLSVLAMAATLVTSVAGTPVFTADAVAASQVPVPSVGAKPTVIMGIAGKAPITTEVEVEGRDLKISKRSYAGSCNNCSLNANYLQCKCRNSAQFEIWTSLDLNTCIANADGALVWRANGGFYPSCWGAPYQSLTGSEMHQTCRQKALNYISATINLNERIHNYNGMLGCAV